MRTAAALALAHFDGLERDMAQLVPELAVIENVHRRKLDPIEEAKA